MPNLGVLWRKIVAGFERDPIDAELLEHFESLRQEYLDLGHSANEAARLARHRLGHQPAISEEVRALSLRHRLESAGRHIRYALRGYGRHGSAYILATSILSLGIALSVTIFSLVDAVVLAPLPFSGGDRVYLVWKTDPANQPHLVGELAYPELDDLYANVPGAEFVALFPAAPYGNGRLLQTATGEPVQIESCPASPNFFKAVGVKPTFGRGFEPGDSKPGAAPVIVISDSVWREHFGSRRDVLNRPVLLNGRAHTVIGVMPPDFDFPRGTGLWVNLSAATRRGGTWLQAVVRLRPGLDRGTLQSAADRTFQLQVADHPKQYAPTQKAVVTPIAEFYVGHQAKMQLLISLAAALLLLLSACVSAGNLFLSRTLSRAPEIATRTALGATRGQVLAQFFMQALVAASLATAAGGVLAVIFTRLLVHWAPASIPRIENAGLNFNALALAVVLAAIAALACVTGPLLLVGGHSTGGRMSGSGTRWARSRRGNRLQQFFVMLQAALTVAILLTAGTLFASYRALIHTDPGVANRDALTVNLALRGNEIGPESYRRIYFEIIDRLRAYPMVTDAAGILLRPMEGPIGWDTEFDWEFEESGRDVNRQLPKANFEVVTPGYFAAVGTPMLQGRDFDGHDSKDAKKVLIISQSLGRRLREAGRNPLGQRMSVFNEWREVVGVVADARFRGIRQASQDVYVPNRQIDIPTNYLVIKGGAPTAELLSLVRRTVKEVAPAQAIAGEATLGQLIERNTARDRFNVMLLLLFAFGAVGLASAGVYSVIRESVAARAKEIAIRVALGAGRGKIAFEAACNVLMCVATGAFTGVIAGWWFGSAAESLLYSVSHRDLTITCCVVALVAGVSAVSSFLPAWSAAGRDPRNQLLAD